jgi:phosphatidylinositol alpha-1,6-mannosyltransferase
MDQTRRSVGATVGPSPGEGEVGEVPRVLVVTNDFPPRVGGVQQYLWSLVRLLPPDRVAVIAPNWPGWQDHDARLEFPVHRWPSTFMWPTPDLGRRIRSLLRQHHSEVVLFGHGLPLPVLGPTVKGEGLPYVVMTHGAEVWLARSPGLGAAFRRVCRGAKAVTAVSEYTARLLRPAVPRDVPLNVVTPGVDADRFSPRVDGTSVRARLGLSGVPVVACVSRLVPRKGQDVLIAGMGLIRSLAPEAVLLLVGEGSHRSALERAARAAPPGAVVFAGQVSDDDLPAFYAACDVFAMPCRSRWAGLEVEGFGIVFLEAAATGKAVVAGRSGGAAEAVADEETGLLVEGAEPKAVALAVGRLLVDTWVANRMGAAGRVRVERGFTWARQAAVLAAILSGAAG